MAKPDILTVAATSGSDGDLGLIVAVPASGTLVVRGPYIDPNIERIDWLLFNSKGVTYQLCRADGVKNTAFGTNAGMNAADTVVLNGKTFTAHATVTVYATGQFAIDGTPTAEAALLARAMNPGYVFTLTSVAVGDYLVIDGVKFKAAATAALNATRCFSQAGTDAQDATSLAASINDTVYGVPGVIATANGAEVHIRNRDEVAHRKEPIVASSGASSIVATATGCQGIVATSAAEVLTVVPKRHRGAYVLQYVGNARFVITMGTRALLYHDAVAVSVDANSVDAGLVIPQYVDGWPYPYLALTNTDSGNANTISVGCARYRYRGE